MLFSARRRCSRSLRPGAGGPLAPAPPGLDPAHGPPRLRRRLPAAGAAALARACPPAIRACWLLAIVCTLGVAATTALYPIIIQQAFNRFAAGDPNVVWLLPPIIIAVTSARAIAMFGQAVATQSVVLRVIEGLQKRLFAALTRADLAQVARRGAGAPRRALHHRCRPDPRGAVQGDQRRRRRLHRDRPGRVDAVDGLEDGAAGARCSTRSRPCRS